MASNLFDASLDSTYHQLLHVDQGVTADYRIVYSGNGVATGLRISIEGIAVGDVMIRNNEITARTPNTDIYLVGNGTGKVVITSGSVTASTATISAATINQAVINQANLTAVTLGNSTVTTAFSLRVATAVNIANAGHSVNLAGNKRIGAMVWDSTNSKIKVATGSSASSSWVDANGTNPVVPA